MLLLNSSSLRFKHTAVVAANPVVYYGSMNSKINCKNRVALRRSRSKLKLHASCMRICSFLLQMCMSFTRLNSIERAFPSTKWNQVALVLCTLWPPVSQQTGHHEHYSCHSCLCQFVGSLWDGENNLKLARSKIVTIKNSILPGEFLNISWFAWSCCVWFWKLITKASSMRVMAQRGICSIYSWRARRLLTLERSCPWIFRIFKLFWGIISLCVATALKCCRIWRQVRMTWKMMQIERYAHPKLRATMFETIVSQKISCAMARVTWLQQISMISLYLVYIDCIETKLRFMWFLSPGAVIQNHNETPQLQRWLFGAQTLGVSNMGPFPMTMQNSKRRYKAANVGIKKRWKAADGHQDQIIRWWFFRSNSDNLYT